MLHKALEGVIILKSFPKTTVDVLALVIVSGTREVIGGNVPDFVPTKHPPSTPGFQPRSASNVERPQTCILPRELQGLPNMIDDNFRS